MSIEKFKTLPAEALAAGYDVLFSGSHHFSRSVCYKACKVMDILNGDVTPGVQAEKWHEFFQVLEASQTGPPIPSPEEWLASQGIDTGGKTLAEIMQAYTDHVAALVHRNTRHEVAEPCIKIFPAEIVTCADGCCTSDGFSVRNENGDYFGFATDTPPEIIKSLIEHVIKGGVKIEIEDTNA